MGVILKYVISFPDAGFKVSNDLLRGDFLLDVSVQIDMLPGANGTSFDLQIFDLPDKKVQALNDLVKGEKPAKVSIQLGYFDDPFGLVVSGVFTEVRTHIEGENMVTRIKGEESATYALRNTPYKGSGKSDPIPFTDAAKKILKDAFPSSGGGGPGGLAAVAASLLGDDGGGGDPIDINPVAPNLDGDQNAPSLRGKTVMDVLVALTEQAEAELVVTDKKVYLGKPVVNDDYKPDEFSRDVNLAVFRPFTKVLPEDPGSNRINALPAKQVLGYFFTIAGDPKLRPGNQVYANVDGVFSDAAGYRKKDGAEFRVLKLEHRLNLSQGYVCSGVAAKVIKDANGQRQQASIAPNKAEDVALRLSQKIKEEGARRPVIEVCAVNGYKEGSGGANPHRATLLFGQKFEKSETQPSVRAPVDADVTQMFANKPIISPFAWHKCGLVTPIYPDMKAVVTHNLALTDDGMVAGFLWSEQPQFDPPQNKPGDWWLCLPVNFDGKTPTDSTNAANDLIANNGHRVIEVSGLRITVGKSTLGTVGTRPTEGNDDDLLLEHKPTGTKLDIDKDGALTITGAKGTTFTIDKNGALTIDCKDALSITAKSVSIKGDVSIEGNVDIK
jgi:hypothetical protein